MWPVTSNQYSVTSDQWPRSTIHLLTLLCCILIASGCGKSEHEIELERKLEKLAKAHDELSKKLDKTQKDLDRTRDDAIEQQGKLRKETQESKRRTALLEGQLAETRQRLARAVTIRRAPAQRQVRGRIGLRRPGGEVTEDYLAQQVAQAVGLSPVQKRHVVLLVRDTRNELRRLWVTARAAGAPTSAFQLLQRDVDQRMRGDIEELLEGGQLQAYQTWEERRRRPAGTVQPRRKNEDEIRRMRAELSKLQDNTRRSSFAKFAAAAQLTPEQRQRLEQADQAERAQLKQLWAEALQDAGQVLNKLEEWQTIRQQTDEQLREILNAEQLDGYREWCDMQAAPRQTGAHRRAWWADGRRPQQQDDL